MRALGLVVFVLLVGCERDVRVRLTVRSADAEPTEHVGTSTNAR